MTVFLCHPERSEGSVWPLLVAPFLCSGQALSNVALERSEEAAKDQQRDASALSMTGFRLLSPLMAIPATPHHAHPYNI